MPRVKVCCISSVEEAAIAIGCGASALGLVAEMPSGPGVITDHQIQEIARSVPPGVSRFLLTSRTDAAGIIDHAESVGVEVIQIVDHVEAAVRERVKAQLPAVRIAQVVHVEDASSVDLARDLAVHADALLLDSGSPGAAVKELGGTGRTHDWSLSRQIVERSQIPVFLAGGLKPSNVAEAVAAVQPFGLDLCSGVRTDGKLDPQKLEAFFAAIRST